MNGHAARGWVSLSGRLVEADRPVPKTGWRERGKLARPLAEHVVVVTGASSGIGGTRGQEPGRIAEATLRLPSGSRYI